MNVTKFRSRQKYFEHFFITQSEFSARNNVKGLMAVVNIRYNPKTWGLFIDSFMHSLKVVLVYTGKVLPSVPVVYAVQKKKTYKNTKEILSCVNYKIYQCHICVDLKVTAIAMGPQKGIKNFVVSCANGIVMPKVFTTARRIGLYVNHIHLEQRT